MSKRLHWEKPQTASRLGLKPETRGGDFMYGDEVVGRVRPMSKARDPFWFWTAGSADGRVPKFNWLYDNNPVPTEQEARDALHQYVKSHLFGEKTQGP